MFALDCAQVLDMQVLAFNGEWENAMILSICFESIKSDRSMWAFEINVGLINRLILDISTQNKNVQAKSSCMS